MEPLSQECQRSQTPDLSFHQISTTSGLKSAALSQPTNTYKCPICARLSPFSLQLDYHLPLLVLCPWVRALSLCLGSGPVCSTFVSSSCRTPPGSPVFNGRHITLPSIFTPPPSRGAPLPPLLITTPAPCLVNWALRLLIHSDLQQPM